MAAAREAKAEGSLPKPLEPSKTENSKPNGQQTSSVSADHVELAKTVIASSESKSPEPMVGAKDDMAKPLPVAPSTERETTNGTTKPVAAAVAPSGSTFCEMPRLSTEDIVNPREFKGDVTTNNDIPTQETLRKIENYVVLDRDGKTHTFKSLYSGPNVPRRVLVVFVRHFFCGNCQEYLRTLSDSITPEALLGLPISTFIVVVGCGSPELIDMYVEATGCPYPVYSDPTRRIYDELGMVRTLAMGERPAYMRKSMLTSMAASVVQGLRQVRHGLATKAGDQRQVGGELLFEPLTIATPVAEVDRRVGAKSFFSAARNALTINGGGGKPQKAEGKKDHHPSTDENQEDDEDGWAEDKRVTWCHRMRNTRDHAEIPELMEVLGLDGQGQPVKDKKLWSKAIETRKGSGLSMAEQMNRLKV